MEKIIEPKYIYKNIQPAFSFKRHKKIFRYLFIYDFLHFMMLITVSINFVYKKNHIKKYFFNRTLQTLFLNKFHLNSTIASFMQMTKNFQHHICLENII